MRINRYLAKAGIASRRAADLLVEEGRIAVNGQVVTRLGTVVDENSDTVTLDGKPVRLPEHFTYLMLHKPEGYLVTCKDRFKRPMAPQLIGRYRKLLRPVGRLDFDSAGLLLFTNDGDLAFRLSHPRYKINKTYLAYCQGYLSDEKISTLENGVELEDGLTAPAKVELLSRSKDYSRFHLTIHEGRNRQVRRMCEAVGCPVVSLTRIALGEISLGRLKKGKFRELRKDEVEVLRRAVGLQET